MRSGRMASEDLQMTNEELLDSLRLINNGKLTRAAVLLFHRNPEKWITGAYIKIGYFGVGSDLRYQDELHGSLFIQADRVVELIYLKFMKAMISYDNVTRIETYPLPKDALREAIYNAIIHSNYAALIPIQIRIHENEVNISNDCIFPIGWSVETLMKRHRSLPHNPLIANGFFRAGYVETWGRGIEKICEACEKHGVPLPEYVLHPEDIMVTFRTGTQDETLSDTLNETLNETLSETINETLSERERSILESIAKNPKITQAQLSENLKIPLSTVKRCTANLQKQGLLKREGAKKKGKWELYFRKE